jgi:hypothetical protein
VFSGYCVYLIVLLTKQIITALILFSHIVLSLLFSHIVLVFFLENMLFYSFCFHHAVMEILIAFCFGVFFRKHVVLFLSSLRDDRIITKLLSLCDKTKKAVVLLLCNNHITQLSLRDKRGKSDEKRPHVVRKVTLCDKTMLCFL